MTGVIIGYGVVGWNLHKEFPNLDIIDPAKGYVQDKAKTWDIGFVSVPTEKREDGSCDTSIVEAVVNGYRDRVKAFIIKSAVPPGTSERLGQSCVSSPEYYGATVHANAQSYDFVILGGLRPYVDYAAEFYKLNKPANFRIIKTTQRTAEYVKYMENSWIAAKVTWMNAFCEVAAADNIDIDELRELFLLDPRVSRSHTFVYRDQPYYDSHCLNKDIPAFLSHAKKLGIDTPFLNAVHDENMRRRRSK